MEWKNFFLKSQVCVGGDKITPENEKPQVTKTGVSALLYMEGTMPLQDEK